MDLAALFWCDRTVELIDMPLDLDHSLPKREHHDGTENRAEQ